MNSILTSLPQYIKDVVDLFYKLSFIIALFYATKALRVYIEKNSKNNTRN